MIYFLTLGSNIVTRAYVSATPEEEEEVIKIFTTSLENGDVDISNRTGVNQHTVERIINKYISSLRKQMKRDGKII